MEGLKFENMEKHAAFLDTNLDANPLIYFNE